MMSEIQIAVPVQDAVLDEMLLFLLTEKHTRLKTAYEKQCQSSQYQLADETLRKMTRIKNAIFALENVQYQEVNYAIEQRRIENCKTL